MRKPYAVLVVGLLAARAAWPCSGPTCEAYFGVVPRPGSTFPANAPALGIQKYQFSESSWDGGTSYQATGIKVFGLSRADGGALSLPSGTSPAEDLFFLGDAGLSPGDELRVTAQLGARCTSTGTLTVGPTAPLPDSAATISLANTRLLRGLGDPCGGPLGTVQHAQLEVTATAAMAPWVPLTRWELEIDGENYATAGYGAVTTTPRVGLPAESGLHPIDTFHVQCAAPTEGGSRDQKLAPGPHQVRLLAHLVGVPDPVPSNTLVVNLDCVPSALDDAGVVTPADAGADQDAGVTPPPPAGGCACAVAPLLSGLAGLLVLRRRRR